MSTVTELVPQATSSVGRARRAMGADLLARAIPKQAVDDAMLVLSEMLSNSLKHARPLDSGRFQVSWFVEGTRIRIEVADGGSATTPRLQRPSASSVGGRGLAIVARVATAWGVIVEPDCTMVWAVVEIRQGSTRP